MKDTFNDSQVAENDPSFGFEGIFEILTDGDRQWRIELEVFYTCRNKAAQQTLLKHHGHDVLRWISAKMKEVFPTQIPSKTELEDTMPKLVEGLNGLYGNFTERFRFSKIDVDNIEDVTEDGREAPRRVLH